MKFKFIKHKDAGFDHFSVKGQKRLRNALNIKLPQERISFNVA